MKNLSEWQYKKIKCSLYCNWSGYGNIYKILVKDKWWHSWKTYAKSLWLEDINEIFEKNI